MNNWISVKEKLPEILTEVLVEVEGHRGPQWRNNHNLVAFFGMDGEFWEERHQSHVPLSVTHWQPLPEPPNDLPKQAIEAALQPQRDYNEIQDEIKDYLTDDDLEPMVVM